MCNMTRLKPTTKKSTAKQNITKSCAHHDVIKLKHFPRYWPFARGIHRSSMNSPHKGQWRGALMFSLICDRINGWVNNREAGDLRRHLAHYDVSVMYSMGDKYCSKTYFTTQMTSAMPRPVHPSFKTSYHSSCKISRPRDMSLELPDRSGISQAPW